MSPTILWENTRCASKWKIVWDTFNKLPNCHQKNLVYLLTQPGVHDIYCRRDLVVSWGAWEMDQSTIYISTCYLRVYLSSRRRGSKSNKQFLLIRRIFDLEEQKQMIATDKRGGNWCRLPLRLPRGSQMRWDEMLGNSREMCRGKKNKRNLAINWSSLPSEKERSKCMSISLICWRSFVWPWMRSCLVTGYFQC